MTSEPRHPGTQFDDLDPRTKEFLRRLSEPERQRVIAIGDLDEKQMARLLRILSLDDDKWEALFKIATKWVLFGNFALSLAWLVGLSTGAIITGAKLWEIVRPYIFGGKS